MAKESKIEKLASKREAAEAKKQELATQIEEIKAKILDSNDEKEKKALRKQRDELIAVREGIVISDEKVTVPMAPTAKKRLQACIAIVVVIALLIVYVATGAVKHGLISQTGAPQRSLTALVMTDNNGKKHNIKVATYNYYYAVNYNSMQQYSQYMAQYSSDTSAYPNFDEKLSKQTYEDEDGNKMPWDEHMQELVLDNIKSVYTYYYAALDANEGKEPEIKESQQEQIDDTIKQYEDAGAGYGYTVDGYLALAMGKGVNEKIARQEMKISYISENYEEEYKKELGNKEYTDEEYNTYYDENKDDLQSVDIMHFVAPSEDEAKEFVAALKDDGSNFGELVYQYSEDKDEMDKDNVNSTYTAMTRGQMEGLTWPVCTAEEAGDEDEDSDEHVHNYPGLDYLFSSDRKAGEKYNDSTSVIYIIKPAYLSDLHPVNVRHILIKPDDMDPANEEGEEDAESTEDTEETTEAAEAMTDEEKDAAASAKAQEILDTFNGGEKTEDAFAALAKENSSDSNADDGGLYENVTPNMMVPTFNAWCFDASRKTGDTAIVKTEYGYHVMYFVSTSDLTVWQYTAQQAMASETSEDEVKEFEDSFTLKTSWLGSRYMIKDTDI